MKTKKSYGGDHTIVLLDLADITRIASEAESAADFRATLEDICEQHSAIKAGFADPSSHPQNPDYVWLDGEEIIAGKKKLGDDFSASNTIRSPHGYTVRTVRHHVVG